MFNLANTKMFVTNHFINKSLSFLTCFRGTYSCDNIPILKDRSRKIFVVNLDKHTGKGTHFVFLEINKDKCYFFDPLGCKLSNTYIKKYLKLIKTNKIVTIKQQIQSDFSNACGLFVISISTARCVNMKWCTILKFFCKHNLHKNEHENIVKLLIFISKKKLSYHQNRFVKILVTDFKMLIYMLRKKLQQNNRKDYIVSVTTFI